MIVIMIMTIIMIMIIYYYKKNLKKDGRLRYCRKLTYANNALCPWGTMACLYFPYKWQNKTSFTIEW